MTETSAPSPRPPRAAYPRHVALGTRWSDNDVYGHVNNVRSRTKAVDI